MNVQDTARTPQVAEPHRRVRIRDTEQLVVDRYGVLVGSRDLWGLLGYPSVDAFRKAAYRGKLPVRVFPIENRRGRFAMASDVAAWIVDQQLSVQEETARLGAEASGSQQKEARPE